MNVLVNDLSAALERTERQTGVEILRALHGIRAECPQPERMTIDAGGQFSARTRFEHGLINPAPRRPLFFAGARKRDGLHV